MPAGTTTFVTAVLPVGPVSVVGPAALSVQAVATAVPPLLFVTCLTSVSRGSGSCWFRTRQLTMSLGPTVTVNPVGPAIRASRGAVSPCVVHEALSPPCWTRDHPGLSTSSKVTCFGSEDVEKSTEKLTAPVDTAVVPLAGLTPGVLVLNVHPPAGVKVDLAVGLGLLDHRYRPFARRGRELFEEGGELVEAGDERVARAGDRVQVVDRQVRARSRCAMMCAALVA